jgi:enoyl-CoA hydratase/carnithine racemase
VEDRHGPLLVALDGGVATVTIDHPPRQLVDGPFLAGLVALLDDVAADPSVRVLVFRSADPDFFLMHGDVEQILRIPVGEHRPAVEPNVAAATYQRLATAPVVSIGMIDGAARGGGSEFLSSLDFRFGTPRTVLGQPEVPLGILPGASGTVRLPRLIGRSRALELILTGRDVAADEARAIGWLDAVVAAEDLEAHALAFAHRIAARPPAAVAAAKQVVDLSLGDPGPALVAETDAFGRLTADGVHRAPMERFLAAGGQTREGETARMAEILAALDEE